MELNALGEFGLIQRFAPHFKSHIPTGIEGIGDDCAVIRQNATTSSLITTDLLIENIHFLKNKISPEELGYKSLAVSLSDIAAMGGRPLYAFLSLGLPGNLDVEWIDHFFKGFQELAATEDVLLLGGDTTRSPHEIMINVLVIGEALTAHIKRRSQALPGDWICCTDYLGNSGAGLKVLLENLPQDQVTLKLVKDHVTPRPHLREGQWLAKHPSVHAMMDISDGIDSDIKRIMEESHCGACIELEHLPLSRELCQAANTFSWLTPELAATAGEDYCLLVTVDPASYNELNQAYQKQFGRPLFKIGQITSSPSLIYLHHGQPFSLSNKGFDHFIAR
ncbi:thiamine-phosphate kinase [Candidatus Protochlamydia phocaeensis]|uniref:thiamine-phosphate kinase n=1 Tax=Candidatus Protochlamydia phocaeensis TaxID=1414722 RepID=UPI0008381347|nr:thiamine-phosphate kinase [Candidatus Protochlamydia phocaeensis]